ncbi:MAG: hypothetical protein L6M37_03780 [Candidatus Methylarchaceae archaeon HK02M1]|nr:hypothetical protein [Candidatus Methylarchaceae archaeon HK02M1]
MSSEEPSKSKEPMKVKELTPNSREVNVIVKVVSISQPRDVTSRRDLSRHRVTDALIGDETGCLYLTLWDEKIDEIAEGKTIRIENGYINLFRGSMRLNIGRYGSFESLEESPISEVNTENNLSDKQYEQWGYRRRRY